MKTQHNFKLASLGLACAAVVVLSGCASALNTADNAEYACPGMPMTVTCKTPGAVYKSTQGELSETEFDTPIQGLSKQPNTQTTAAMAAGSAGPSNFAATAPRNQLVSSVTSEIGVKPIREPAQVVRIWIAPWIDKNDNLNLAQYQYAEVKPRTWTVGIPERGAGGGYVIPRQAVQSANSGKAASVPVAAQRSALPSIPDSRPFGGPVAPDASRTTGGNAPSGNDLPAGYTPFPSKDAPN